MRILLIAGILLLVLGCQTRGPELAPGVRDICTDLGWMSHVISSHKAQGNTRNDQILWANSRVAIEKPRHACLRIIHFVYEVDSEPLETDLASYLGCERQFDGAATLVLGTEQPR